MAIVIQPSKELEEIINFIRAKCLLAGKKPPSKQKITKYIANNIDKERLWHNVFIKLK